MAETSSTKDCENDKYRKRERWLRPIPRAIRLVSNSVLPLPGGTLITRLGISPLITLSIASAIYSWCQFTKNLNPIRGRKNARVKNKCSSSHLILFAFNLTGSIFALEFIYRLPYLLISGSNNYCIFVLNRSTTCACDFLFICKLPTAVFSSLFKNLE